MSIKKLYSNELLASFEYSNIDKDYDFYYVTTSDKYIKGGATFLDIDDIKISALQFESGKSFWVMLPKNAISRAEFVRLLNAKEDGDSLSIKSMTKELVNKAEDYRIAKEIREYIQAMIDSGNEDITPEWIEWALKKADWYDPSIKTEDEYLGKRQHEKSAEEKEKSLQDSIRKSWYW